MSLTGCHIWRQIMPTGGVNSSHSGKVLSRPGLCNLLFSFSSQSVPSILFIFLSVNYWYRLMSSCLPMVYKSLLNSIILVLELSWLGQWEPLQAGSCVHMVFSPSFFFLRTLFTLGIMRCSRIILYILCPSPGISHFFEELRSLLGEKVYNTWRYMFSVTLSAVWVLGQCFCNFQLLGWWILGQVEMTGCRGRAVLICSCSVKKIYSEYVWGEDCCM